MHQPNKKGQEQEGERSKFNGSVVCFFQKALDHWISYLVNVGLAKYLTSGS